MTLKNELRMSSCYGKRIITLSVEEVNSLLSEFDELELELKRTREGRAIEVAALQNAIPALVSLGEAVEKFKKLAKVYKNKAKAEKKERIRLAAKLARSNERVEELEDRIDEIEATLSGKILL